MNFPTKVTLVIFAILSISFSGGYLTSMKSTNAFGGEVLTKSELTNISRILNQRVVKGVDSIITTFHEKRNFSGNVLVNYRGHKIYHKTVGYANPRKRTSLEKGMPYQLASVSKQFTAVAVMLLQDQNKIAYTDTVTQYLPQFPYKAITVRQLLNHTSGLPNYMWIVEHHWNKEEDPYNDDVVDLLAEHDLRLYFRPGTRFYYSNTGYAVLARIVEKASGQTFGDYLDKHIFKPLGMNNTFVYSSALDKDYPDRVKGFRPYGRYYREVPENRHDGVVGDKGIYSTAEDLYKWDKALYNNKILDEKQKELAFSKATLENGNDINYGFGFRLKVKNGKQVVYHNGLWNGFRTSLKRHVEDSFSVIVLNNTDSRHKGTLVRSLENYMQKHAEKSKIQQQVFNAFKYDIKSVNKDFDQLTKGQTQKIEQVIHYLKRNKKKAHADKLRKFYGKRSLAVDEKSKEFNLPISSVVNSL